MIPSCEVDINPFALNQVTSREREIHFPLDLKLGNARKAGLMAGPRSLLDFSQAHSGGGNYGQMFHRSTIQAIEYMESLQSNEEEEEHRVEVEARSSAKDPQSMPIPRTVPSYAKKLATSGNNRKAVHFESVPSLQRSEPAMPLVGSNERQRAAV